MSRNGVGQVEWAPGAVPNDASADACGHFRTYWCRVVAPEFSGWARYCKDCSKGVEFSTAKPTAVAAEESVPLADRLAAHDWTHLWMGIPACGRCGALAQGGATLSTCGSR